MARPDDAPPKTHDSDGQSLRRIGLTLAAVAALGAIAVIVWAAAFRAPATRAPEATVAPLEEPFFNPLEDGPVAATAEPEDIQDLVQSAEDAELQFFDPADESLRGKMTFARLDPQPNGRFFAESPEAWLLMSSDMSARITSRETTFRMPAGSGEPESGRFAGDVRIELHPGRLDTEDAQDASDPVAVFSMDELHFDAALGQLRTASEVAVDARGVVGSFQGLEAVIDEPARRLSHLSTRGGGWLRRTPVPSDPAAEESDVADDGESRPAGSARVDFYEARLDGGVRIESGDRIVTSDQLEIWARLVDGGLPEDALASFLTVAGAPDPAAESPQSGEAPAEAMIRWDGRLVVSPLDEAPEELGRDQLAGRFSSPASGLVEIRDPEAGVEATGASVAYGATTRRLTMTGPGSTGVSFSAPGAGTLVCGRLEADLTAGRVLMPGPGELRAEADPGDDRRVARTVSWQRGARLELETMGEHVDLSGRWPLRVATFDGGAVAREGEAEVAGDAITARFEPTDAGGGALTQVVVEGDARALAPDAGDGRSGRLLGERITVDFRRRGTTGEQAITPESVLVEGRALAERGAEGIEAEILRARLGHDPTTDELRVESLEAELDVLVRGAGGEEAIAESVVADPLRGVYDLVGEPVILRSRGAAVQGGSMRIDEIQEQLTVFGPGELTYRETREDAEGYQNVTVAWAGAMTFDGVMERAEFSGDVVVVGEPDDLTRDTLRGERVIVEVDLAAEGSSGGTEAAFKRAQIIGEVEELGEGRTAQVESRRYRVDPASESGLALEFLAYLDGPTLVADAATETLMAPAAGRLLFEDRRGEAADAGPSEGLSTRGTTLFEWDGAARFDRARGEAVMTRGVRLRQKPRGEQRVTELEGERLEAKFALPGSESASAGVGEDAALGARLKTARASGAVYARQGDRELIADRLEYDTEAGVAQAWANEGNLVTIFDAARPIPVTGSVLRWDLERDRIEWRDAGATTAPR